MKSIKYTLAAVSLALLAACGGGGGGSGEVSEVKENLFDLKSIHESYLSTPHNYNEIDSGTVSGITYSGSGTRTITPLTSSTFENSSALVVTETRSGTLNFAGQISDTSSEIKNYYNLSKQQIGYTQKDIGSATLNNYGVVKTVPTSYPSSAKIGDSGNLWTMDFYTDATKKQIILTQRAAWQLKQGIGSSVAILEITTTMTAPNNTTTIKNVEQYSIDSQKRMLLAKETNEITNGDNVIASTTTTFTGQ